MVRFAVLKDVEKILEIYRPYVEATTVSFEWEVPSLETFKTRFEKITAEFPWLVYEIGGEIAGYAYPERAFERTAYQWSADLAVYIQREYQGQGVGRRLYRAAEECLKAQGYVNVYALVTQENQTSVAFHKAVGYTETARFPKAGFKMGQWLDVVWFQKVLAEHPICPNAPIGIHEINQQEIKTILEECNHYAK